MSEMSIFYVLKKREMFQIHFKSRVACGMNTPCSQDNPSLLFLLIQAADPAMEGIKKPIRKGKTPKQHRQFVRSVMQILPRVTNKPFVHILTSPIKTPLGKEPK